ncbi:MAG TPA: endonuclease III, partial [Deltaproteobacteria bacterium]|nr:endonuclease III [Deltaproteobacteria bacterium]
MTNDMIDTVFEILAQEVLRLREPIVGRIARKRDPFKVLVSTMLSLRTKDSTTEQACTRLFGLVHACSVVLS